MPCYHLWVPLLKLQSWGILPWTPTPQSTYNKILQQTHLQSHLQRAYQSERLIKPRCHCHQTILPSSPPSSSRRSHMRWELFPFLQQRRPTILWRSRGHLPSSNLVLHDSLPSHLVQPDYHLESHCVLEGKMWQSELQNTMAIDRFLKRPSIT